MKMKNNINESKNKNSIYYTKKSLALAKQRSDNMVARKLYVIILPMR